MKHGGKKNGELMKSKCKNNLFFPFIFFPLSFFVLVVLESGVCVFGGGGGDYYVLCGGG